MVKIVWTQLAIDDMNSIHGYISKESRVYANRMIEKFLSRVQQLEYFPESGKIVPEFR
jgi:toxin ParE1/3/4